MYLRVYLFSLLFLFVGKIVTFLVLFKRVRVWHSTSLFNFMHSGKSFLKYAFLVDLTNFCFDFASEIPTVILVVERGSLCD